MAKRSNSPCFAKADLKPKDIEKLERLAAKYNSTDPNADYAAAAHDMLAETKALVEAIQTAMVAKAKAAAAQEAPAAGNPRMYGRDGTVDTGFYSGAYTEVTDKAKFAQANPGYAKAVEQLAAAGLSADHIDTINLAHDGEAFDAFGALHWNSDAGKLELWLDRDVLENPELLSFTVRHEIGHVADGAFGTNGLQQYTDQVTRAHLAEANRLAQQESQLGDAMYGAMSYEDPVRRGEELVANLVAIATGPNGTKGLPPNLAKFATEILNHAKDNYADTVARAKAAAAADVEKARAEGVSSVSESGSGSGVQEAAGKVRESTVRFSRSPVSDAARRVGGASTAMLAEDATHFVKKAANAMLFLHDIVDKYKATVPAIGKWYAEVQGAVAQRTRYEREAERIANLAEQLPNGAQRVNDFISRSTFEQKWGYAPAFKPGAVIDPAMARAFGALSEREKEVVREVFAHGEKMRLERENLLRSLGVNDKVFSGYSKLEGPYAPLKRFGNYVAVLKSQALRNAETAEDNALVEKLKADPTHYVVSYFDTKGQARQFAWSNDKANGGKFEFTDDFEKSERPHEGQTVPYTVMQEVLAAMKINPDMDPKSHAAATDMVRNMMLQYMDEFNARTTGLRRMNRAGYDADMMRSFLANARAEASFLSNVRHGEKISSAYQEMHTQAKDKPSGQRLYQDAVNTVAEHYADMLNYKETPWQDRAMALTSAMQLATSVGYHAANAMQGFMVSLPKLAADHNDYGGAWRNLLSGYKLMGQAGVGNKFDINKVQSKGLRETLQHAMDMGVLDVGMNEDLSHLEATRTGIGAIDNTTKVARSALHKLNQVARGIEITNRVSAAAAAYNMAMEKGKGHEEAKQYALRMLQSTQGDFSRVGAPLLLKKLPKMVTQYKKFQFMMAALYTKAFQQAFYGASDQERAIGRRMLAYKLAHTGVAAGLLGMPMMNLVSMVFGAMGAAGEPPDFERDLRKAIGDETMANLLLHGPLAAAGLDTSAKLGEDKIFSILPYGNWDLTSASGLAKTAADLAGPAVSQAGRLADGIGFMQRGDYYKGVEKFMPKGVADAMKAFRIANDGYTLKNGDLMMKPEDINGFALALDALGMPSSEMKRMDWLKNQQYEITQFYQQQTKQIEQDYVKASKEKDQDAMAQSRQDWMNLQDGKNRLRYLFNDSHDALKVQPLSTLLRAPHNQAKREQKLQHAAGVTG